MSTPTVTYPDQDKVNIYGFYLQDPTPILIETVAVKRAEARLADLARSMSSNWHLVIWEKTTPMGAGSGKGKRRRSWNSGGPSIGRHSEGTPVK